MEHWHIAIHAITLSIRTRMYSSLTYYHSKFFFNEKYLISLYYWLYISFRLYLRKFVHMSRSSYFSATEFKSINPEGPLKYIAIFDSQLNVYVSVYDGKERKNPHMLILSFNLWDIYRAHSNKMDINTVYHKLLHTFTIWTKS